MKHIESIQPEYAADDMTALLLSDATASAALSRLLHDWTGCAIPQTDTTPQSDVDELVPLAVSILRRHWQTPLTCLGDGNTPMSLADLLRRFGDRVQGNEAMCIPPVHDNIPAAVSALRERKIGGVPDAPDGVSLPRLLCDSTIPPITELIDDNIGWVMSKAFSGFPSIKSVTLGAKRIEGKFTAFGTLDEFHSDTLEHIGMPSDKTYGFYPEECFLATTINSEELYLPALRKVYNGAGNNIPALGTLPNCKRIILPSLADIRTNGSGWLGPGTGSTRLANAPECLELITNIGGNTNRNNASASYIFINAPKLQKFVLGGVLSDENDKGLFYTTSPDLIHLEIGGATCSLYMQEWKPTNVLADQDKLATFLSNFRLYIADRLSDNGSGKTLTLSQEVRDAIHSAGIDTIITNKGWTISPVPTQQ